MNVAFYISYIVRTFEDGCKKLESHDSDLPSASRIEMCASVAACG